MSRMSFLIPAAAVALLGTACTSQTAYYTTQELQKEQCRKLLDMAERQRCEKSATMGYDQYKAETDAVKRTPGKPAP
jgi:hypothetical protein